MNLIYTTYHKEIELKSYNDELTIWFFGDVHRDTASCDVDRWKQFIKKSSQDDAYYFGMGDYHDFVSIGEKKKLDAAHLHETTLQKFDEIVERENRAFSGEISYMRGRLLGLIEGNHHWTYETGKSSTEDLAERMDAPYLGWLCHYTLTVKLPGTTTVPIHIVACHGRAGGKTYGITLNQVADLKMIFPVAEIYCMGHDHQRVADCISVLVPTISGKHGWKIKQKEQLLCRSGSFKKSYEPGKAGYEAAKLLKPSNLGALKVTIGFRRIRNDEEDRVYTELSALV